MAIYEIEADRIRKIEETSFGRAGLKERADLQRLLCRQIEVIAPDTLIIAEEFGEWEDSKRRIDLLGLDKGAKLVVIELKRTEDGGHMELQAIRYAAMVSAMTFEKVTELHARFLAKIGSKEDARSSILSFLDWEEPDEERFAQDVRIILAAAEFSKELTTTVMWLNNRGLDVTCVRIKPYRDGSRVLADVQQVIPLPEAADYMVKIKEKEVRERIARLDRTKLGDWYERFWSGLQERAAGVTDMHRNLMVSRKHWYGGRHNGPGMNFNYVICGDRTVRVDAYIFGLAKMDAKTIFDGLWKDKAAIERRFGGELGWQRLDEKIACRIKVDLPEVSVEDEAEWPEVQKRLIDTMIRFEKALRPSIERLEI